MEANGPKPYRLSAVLTRRGITGLALVASAVVGVGAAFAYTAGWLSPGRLSQGRVVDRLEWVNGKHPGFRRNHAKGVCFSGAFDSSGAAQGLSEAVVFKPGSTPVFGRFALAGGKRKSTESLIVYDHLGAGDGDLIAFTESREAAMPFYPEKRVPLDAYNAAILDAAVIEMQL